ncbi:hypothetical protein [Parachitinimonas caeni]|uniref:Uncharacterized protein n=1 Tax=Parachitinimonas caeni TaxID=3031301 RepID=A0ABT7E379_9NEIS|nr:hypothetical protein [Parachitinimonas caeni]MDK2126769.1 hypothetical protein [Parachitinimonas caeni]
MNYHQKREVIIQATALNIPMTFHALYHPGETDDDYAIEPGWQIWAEDLDDLLKAAKLSPLDLDLLGLVGNRNPEWFNRIFDEEWSSEDDSDIHKVFMACAGLYQDSSLKIVNYHKVGAPGFYHLPEFGWVRLNSVRQHLDKLHLSYHTCTTASFSYHGREREGRILQSGGFDWTLDKDGCVALESDNLSKFLQVIGCFKWIRPEDRSIASDLYRSLNDTRSPAICITSHI